MKDFFLNEKPVDALVLVKESEEELYSRKIAGEIDATYSHTVNILSRLENEDLLETTRKGRKKVPELTDRGRELASHFQDVMDSLSDSCENSDLRISGSLEDSF